PGARVIGGAGARRSAVAAGLRRASIFHFAGHAVADDDHPERSFLVLAPGDGDPSGRLTAEEIGGMDLRHVRLVVLSACETLPGRGGRSGGFAGFAGALLASGAGGVAGSLWQVDDAHTRALMTELHRAYRASGDPPAALREAQLRLFRSGGALRSPAAWAAFRYVGS
ncbi:MAG TPA: CHAT domain-containing protein, partial [Longimicrobium sp.]|nr:CHAT domain-containing protein [Longimicrobium sp.]